MTIQSVGDDFTVPAKTFRSVDEDLSDPVSLPDDSVSRGVADGSWFILGTTTLLPRTFTLLDAGAQNAHQMTVAVTVPSLNAYVVMPETGDALTFPPGSTGFGRWQRAAGSWRLKLFSV